MKTLHEVVVKQWLAEPLSHAVRRALDQLRRTDDVHRIAVMPDVHLAEDVCIGTVMATTRLLYPQAVGGDIGCGMSTVRLNGQAALLSDERTAAKMLHKLARIVPSIRHSSGVVNRHIPEYLMDLSLSDPVLEKLKKRDARVQLGTLGRGNHFLEFQTDEEGSLWLMVHSGSRMMGGAIRDHHLRNAAEATTGFLYVDSDTKHGRAYLQDMCWALQYAEENRQEMIRSTVRLVEDVIGITADWSSAVSCHHNHVRQEMCEGVLYWVHRKGAIWAGYGVPGIIPGSMGTASCHVEGRGHEASLQSSSHGTGRVMSRGHAYRTMCIDQLKREMKGVWFDQRHLAHLRDEAPSAYKDITRVMRAQRELTKIFRVLRPVLSYKAVS
ncbi:MAG: RtcB family protein [Nitrospira sp.]|nr:RtcB family protein [Nitrospira sp.]